MRAIIPIMISRATSIRAIAHGGMARVKPSARLAAVQVAIRKEKLHKNMFRFRTMTIQVRLVCSQHKGAWFHQKSGLS